MFEQSAASSPEPRGRSPGSSSAVDDTSRPTSKVRASFVSVEHPMPHASDFAGINKASPSNSTAANRRESFSMSEDTTGTVADIRQSISDEREERRKSVAIIDPVPEQAVASRESSAGPPPIRGDPEGDIVNLGHIMKGSEFPESSSDTDAGAPQPEEAPAPELAVVKEEPVKEAEAAPEPVEETPAENPDKATTGAQEEVSLKPADPTDASAVSGGKALPAPAEELKPASAAPATKTPKPASSSVKANGTPAKKGRLEPTKPAAISTTKASTSKSTPLKSPLPKTMPRTPTNVKPSAAAPASKPAAPVSKPAATAKPAAKPVTKEPVKAAAPKPKTSHPSLRQSSATAPTAAAKAKAAAAESKKPAPTKPRYVSSSLDMIPSNSWLQRYDRYFTHGVEEAKAKIAHTPCHAELAPHRSHCRIRRQTTSRGSKGHSEALNHDASCIKGCHRQALASFSRTECGYEQATRVAHVNGRC
jgi:hypothetical protein